MSWQIVNKYITSKLMSGRESCFAHIYIYILNCENCRSPKVKRIAVVSWPLNISAHTGPGLQLVTLTWLVTLRNHEQRWMLKAIIQSVRPFYCMRMCELKLIEPLQSNEWRVGSLDSFQHPSEPFSFTTSYLNTKDPYFA